MKFFRSFQILHRRTKSATFESGPAGAGAQLKLSPSQKRSSLPSGPDSNALTSSIFGLVTGTSKQTPVPPAFNHLRPAPSVVPTAVQPSSRPSRASLEVQLLAVEENARLREALDMWYREYIHVERLLREYRSELALERQCKEVLELQSARNQEVIKDLNAEISRQEVWLARSDEPKIPTICSHCSHELPDVSSSILRPGIASQSTVTSRLPRSMKNRTLDDYQSALRATLFVRSQLRSQKKKAKFWKNKAISSGQCDGVVTPSISAISSINEPLNEERKTAVDMLMRERGLILPCTKPMPHSDRDVWTSPPYIEQKPLRNQSTSSCTPGHNTITPPQRFSSDELAATSRNLTLTSTSSELSAISSSNGCLAPLASDSLKAEIGMFFGIQESSSRWFSSSKQKGLRSSASGSSSMVASSSPKPYLGPKLSTWKPPQVHLSDLTLPIEPYDDLSWIFQNPMSSGSNNRGPARKGLRCLPAPDSPWQILDLSGSTLASTSFPSGSSGVFLQSHSDLTSVTKPLEASCSTKPPETFSQSGWRWQKHLAQRKHSVNTDFGVMSASTTAPQAKVVDEERRSVLGLRRPFSRLKKNSGLPVLSPGKP